MSTWYYKAMGQEFGPISSTELKQLVATGGLQSESEVRRNDMNKWTKARRVEGLFASVAMSGANHCQELPVQDMRVVPESVPTPSAAPLVSETSSTVSATSNLAHRVVNSIKTSALLAAKQAQLKSAEWELRRADETTGTNAFAKRVAEIHFSDLYSVLQQLDAAIADKQKPTTIPTNEALTDRAMRLAQEGKKKLDLELLSTERRKRLRELGEQIRATAISNDAPDLAVELQHAIDSEAKVALLTLEIESLSRKAPLWPKTLIAAAALFVVVAGYFAVSHTFGRDNNSSETISAATPRIDRFERTPAVPATSKTVRAVATEPQGPSVPAVNVAADHSGRLEPIPQEKVDKVSATSFTAKGYSNEAFFQAIYDGRQKELKIDPQEIAPYLLEFAAKFRATAECDGIISNYAYAKLAEQAQMKVVGKYLGQLAAANSDHRQGDFGAAAKSGYEHGRQFSLDLAQNADQAQNDARLFYRRHGCDSAVAARFFEHLNSYMSDFDAPSWGHVLENVRDTNPNR